MPNSITNIANQGWKYLAIFVATLLVYDLFFHYMITTSDYGIFLVTVPLYLIYLLIVSAALLVTLGVYSASMIRYRSTKRGVSSGFYGTFSVLVGGISAGCACQAPILYGVLYFVGLNSLEASSFVTIFSSHEKSILEILILLNILLIFAFSLRIQERMKKRNSTPKMEVTKYSDSQNPNSAKN